MQDKETVDEAEEALTTKGDSISKTPDKKETDASKKESAKDGKFAFKKMKQPKKEKTDKNKPDKKKYEGEGVIFKAKLIGVESVSDARGDKMCQEATKRLKLNVKNLGPHKRKISVAVSLQGIKIKDEKTGAVMYHHPVSLISFISQDITDARTFGYVFGSTSEPHQFIAIKTEKPVRLSEYLQTRSKTEEISSTEEKANTENVVFEVLMTEPAEMIDESPKTEENYETIDDLLGLQDELNQLQKGIEQMDTSIAAATAFNSEVPILENDPFDTSFVLGPKRDSFAVPMPTPIAAPIQVGDTQPSDFSANGDKYAVFNVIDSGPSIFEGTSQESEAAAEMQKLEEEIAKKSAPPKPPRLSKTDSTDLSIFAELDPLGKDRPYKDKTEFFQDVKNPPKKVLNDLVDPNREASKLLDVNLLISSPVPFPVDFENTPPPVLPSSSLPNALPSNLKLSLVNSNGDIITHNPKVRSESEPVNPALFNAHLERPLSNQQLNVNCTNLNYSQMNSTSSSSPIPIPPRMNNVEKDLAFSNGSMGSPYSKSPQPYVSDSPNNADYFNQNYNNFESSSPTGYRNGLQQTHFMNGENGNSVLINGFSVTKHNNINGLSNSTNNHNGVSRPRPRPSLNKGGTVQNGGRTVSSHSLSSDSSSDYEMISKENMQSITSVLLSNGHRLRAQSLNIESNRDLKLQMPSEKNIFAKKNDPFADDFFFSLPKKTSHLTKAEIPEYV
ncbi:disabled homolog 2 [Parasteatoda tepidariorum]|uniref:disabled homolog 2 n=1 Tax=Parasteatoda tepidariorum TaxID=114398 RepID=UPI0039BC7B83